MTEITIRPARPEDAKGLCDVINPLIREGGTTAHRTLFDADRALHHYITPDDLISCMVAVNSDDVIVGFQSLQWREVFNLPNHSAEIGTFVSATQHKQGIGPLLFAATLENARSVGASVLDATIRADNVPGLAFYSKISFENHHIYEQVPLSDGTLVDRIQKVFWT